MIPISSSGAGVIILVLRKVSDCPRPHWELAVKPGPQSEARELGRAFLGCDIWGLPEVISVAWVVQEGGAREGLLQAEKAKPQKRTRNAEEVQAGCPGWWELTE